MKGAAVALWLVATSINMRVEKQALYWFTLLTRIRNTQSCSALIIAVSYWNYNKLLANSVESLRASSGLILGRGTAGEMSPAGGARTSGVAALMAGAPRGRVPGACGAIVAATQHRITPPPPPAAAPAALARHTPHATDTVCRPTDRPTDRTNQRTTDVRRSEY
ncbi:unnamed protein product [Danaus chrysippus]|uniref:(African queen) hypothetical protein n=1 Tax=Danaus chrysippus TaxID=151541 RepID=A0A8J2RG76_9NEOP|nr:unnamed protein product [Danaus chrysippus]